MSTVAVGGKVRGEKSLGRNSFGMVPATGCQTFNPQCVEWHLLHGVEINKNDKRYIDI